MRTLYADMWRNFYLNSRLRDKQKGLEHDCSSPFLMEYRGAAQNAGVIFLSTRRIISFHFASDEVRTFCLYGKFDIIFVDGFIIKGGSKDIFIKRICADGADRKNDF